VCAHISVKTIELHAARVVRLDERSAVLAALASVIRCSGVENLWTIREFPVDGSTPKIFFRRFALEK